MKPFIPGIVLEVNDREVAVPSGLMVPGIITCPELTYDNFEILLKSRRRNTLVQMMNSSGHTHGSTNGCKWAIWGLLATHIYYKWRIFPYRSPTKVVLADDGRRSCAPSDLRPRFDGDSCLNAQHVSWVWATGNIARPWLEVKTTLLWCTSMMLQFSKTWEVDTRTIGSWIAVLPLISGCWPLGH